MEQDKLHEDRNFEVSADLPIYKTWESMKLKPELYEKIIQLNWKTPSPVQSRAIIPISSGRNILLQSQNGTGKTPTFSIGTLQRINLKSPFCQLIVLSPTRELAIQTNDILQSLGSNSRACVGGNQYRKDLKALQQGGIQSISGTPGRVLQLIREHFIDPLNVLSVVIDEADEMMTSLGRTVTDTLDLLKKAQRIIVTATVSDEVVGLITGYARDALRFLVPRDELTLSGVSQYYIKVKEDDYKFSALIDLYQSVPIERAVIFVNTIGKSKWLRDKFIDQGFTVALANSELSTEERELIAEGVKTGETRVLIATDVWARGIDVRNVTLVINYDIPTSVETYLHRIGRSGRFGRKGIAITITAPGDEKKIKKIENYYSSKILPLPYDLDKLFF